MRRIWCMAGISLALAACGGKYAAVPIDETLTEQTRIAILPLNMPEKLSVDVQDNKLGLLGTAGRITVIKGQDTKRRKFTETVLDQGYQYQEQLSSAVRDQLNQAGLMAEYVDFRRSKDNILEAVPPGKFEKRYPDRFTDHDFLLDIAVEYVGYAANGLSKPYYPTLHVRTRLVDSSSLDTVYESRIQYHPHDNKGEEKAIEADAVWVFRDFDQLIDEPGRAIDGLNAAINQVIGVMIADMGL